MTTVESRARKDVADYTTSRSVVDMNVTTGVPELLTSIPVVNSTLGSSEAKSLLTPVVVNGDLNTNDVTVLKEYMHELLVEPYHGSLTKRPRKPLVFKQESRYEDFTRNQFIGQFRHQNSVNFTNELEESRSLFGLVGISLTPYAAADFYSSSWTQVIHITNPFTEDYVREGLSTLTNVCYAPEFENESEKLVMEEIRKQCMNSLNNGKFSTWSLISQFVSLS
ncbi:hypothetical protein HDE_05255 [Halotydeus destructor]|nr:hypothetical protein HDE_05255 [Halotydeus destructor]